MNFDFFFVKNSIFEKNLHPLKDFSIAVKKKRLIQIMPKNVLSGDEKKPFKLV